MASLLGRIKPLYMILSFFVGIIYVQYTVPQPTLVVKFPSPYNAGMVQYTDKAENCYRYKSHEVPCSHEALPQPVMESYHVRNPSQI